MCVRVKTSSEDKKRMTKMWCSVSMIAQSVLACAFAVLLYQYINLHREFVGSGGKKADDADIEDSDNAEPSILETGTSVWCRGYNPGDRLCRFKNLCFDPQKDEYIFLHGPETVISGLPRTGHKHPAVDLSSVEDHNVLQLVYVDLPVDVVTDLYEINMIVEPSLIVYRFKPDNLMHVFHDDLLPLFNTLVEMCGGNAGRCPDDLQFVFTDPWPEGTHWNLYTVFTRSSPLLMTAMPENILYCFKPSQTYLLHMSFVLLQNRYTDGRTADYCRSNYIPSLLKLSSPAPAVLSKHKQEGYIGLNRKSVWYQYGFTTPQSPISNPQVTAHDIRRFTTYFASLLPQLTPSTCDPDHRVTVLLSRKATRLILNEADVVEALVHEIGFTVTVLSLDDHTFVDILAHVRCADVLVGVHGALLVLAMFLKPGAIFIELFPYGIPPQDYTPYRTLATLPGMGIVYKPWRNRFADKTVTHPNWPADFGGIAHLTLAEQQRIEIEVQVPQHLCCHDPMWLYRIYQDTEVDIPSFSHVLQDAVQERETLNATQSYVHELQDIMDLNLFPGKVENLTCTSLEKERGITVMWQEPWNLHVLPSMSSAQYEVWAQLTGEAEHRAYVTNSTFYIIRGLSTNELLNLWIRCKTSEEQIGPFKYIGCRAADPTKVDIKY